MSEPMLKDMSGNMPKKKYQKNARTSASKNGERYVRKTLEIPNAVDAVLQIDGNCCQQCMVGYVPRNAKAKEGETRITCRILPTGLESRKENKQSQTNNTNPTNTIAREEP